MPSKESSTPIQQKKNNARTAERVPVETSPGTEMVPLDGMLVQAALSEGRLSPAALKTLQRKAGNRAVVDLVERTAAEEVLQTCRTPGIRVPGAAQGAGPTASGEEELVQTSRMPGVAQEETPVSSAADEVVQACRTPGIRVPGAAQEEVPASSTEGEIVQTSRMPGTAVNIVQRVNTPHNVTALTVTNAAAVGGGGDTFVVIRGAPPVTVTATVDVPVADLRRNELRWSTGTAGADQTVRNISATSPGRKVITVRTATSTKRVTLFVVNAQPLPAAVTPAVLEHILAGRANPGTDFGLTVVTIGTQGVKGPTFEIDAFFAVDRWRFRVRRIRHRYKLGVHSLGRTQISGPQNVRPGTLRAVVTDFTPVGAAPPMAPMVRYWNQGIVQRHEEAHVTHFYGAPFWETSMRTFETEVAAQEVIFDPTDRTTQSARAVLARERAAWKTRIEALHTAADTAEIPSAETFAYGVENPLWAALVATIVAGVRPPPVTGLAVGAVTDTTATINWNYATINETGFEVQRRTGRGAFAPVGVVATGTTTFTDSALTPGTRYTYRVMATGAAGNSTHQQVQANTTAPPPPGP